MKQTRYILASGLCMLLFTSNLKAQSDKELIAQIRHASNSALKAYDTEAVLSYLTEDVLTTTGNGTLLCGKRALAEYIGDGSANKMYWVRETKEITVNAKRGLAWESGLWNGYDPGRSKQSVINGRYSAMWTKASGVWKIKSQLFVTLDEK